MYILKQPHRFLLKHPFVMHDFLDALYNITFEYGIFPRSKQFSMTQWLWICFVCCALCVTMFSVVNREVTPRNSRTVTSSRVTTHVTKDMNDYHVERTFIFRPHGALLFSTCQHRFRCHFKSQKFVS